MMSLNSILLIDPFKNLLNAYRMILEEEKYLVETAQNLKEAYELLNRGRYSIIITEYIPPVETTDYLIKWMKKNTPETYIIVVTNAFIDEKTYENLFNIGADDFILKPYSPEKILVHIRKGLKLRNLSIRMRQLERMNVLEPMTEQVQGVVFNPNFFKKCLRQELKRTRRHQHALSLLLLELPKGGETGGLFDRVYMELVKIVRKSTREEDIVGREGGHIGILLPETDETGSKALMERLLKLMKGDPSLKSDKDLKPYVETLSFRSFTYPGQFTLPESLGTFLEEMKKEYPYI
jgi:PleD family two-component response regulator